MGQCKCLVCATKGAWELVTKVKIIFIHPAFVIQSQTSSYIEPTVHAQEYKKDII